MVSDWTRTPAVHPTDLAVQSQYKYRLKVQHTLPPLSLAR